MCREEAGPQSPPSSPPVEMCRSGPPLRPGRTDRRRSSGPDSSLTTRSCWRLSELMEDIAHTRRDIQPYTLEPMGHIMARGTEQGRPYGNRITLRRRWRGQVSRERPNLLAPTSRDVFSAWAPWLDSSDWMDRYEPPHRSHRAGGISSRGWTCDIHGLETLLHRPASSGWSV